MIHLVIPARNEAPYIAETIRCVVRSLTEAFGSDWQLTIAENGSTDGTVDIAESSIGDKPSAIDVLRCPVEGKGAAIRFAAERSVADLFGFLDADLSAEPDMIGALAEAVRSGQADVAIGSRLLHGKTTDRSFPRTWSSRLFNAVARAVFGWPIRDAQCGLKVMNARGADILRTCAETGWFLDIEFLAKAQDAGLRIVEIPVPWTECRYAGRRSQIRHVSDGWDALRAMRRICRKRNRPDPPRLRSGQASTSSG